MTAFCDIAPCSLIVVDRCFRREYCLHHQGAISQKVVILMLLNFSYCLEVDAEIAP